MTALTRRFDTLVDHWVDEGLITAEQAGRMHAEVATLDSPDDPDGAAAMRANVHSASLLGEALGYVGGAVVLVGVMLIGAWYWGDLATAPRLAVLVGAALLLLVAGGFTPAAAGAVQHRLRSVLWLASTGVATGALGILAADVLDTSDADTFLIVAGGTAGYTAALWAAGRAFVQQAAMVVSAAVTAAALINRGDFSDDLPGLGPWAVGVAWAVLGWLEVARPRRLVIASGSVLAVVGAMTTVGADAGMALTLATAASIIGLAVLWRDLPLLAIGTVAGLVNTRVAMTRWFPESISAAFGLVVVGLALLGAALWVTRSGRGRALPR